MFKLQSLVTVLFLCAISVFAQNQPPAKATPSPTPANNEKAMLLIAEQWLQLIDEEKFSQSWEQAAAIFKDAVPKDHWIETAAQTRKPLGKIKTRKLKYSQATDKLQGVPAGQYFLLQLESVYEKRDAAKELVTLALEKDGKWRVVGYFLQ